MTDVPGGSTRFRPDRDLWHMSAMAVRASIEV
jgi:hypothetical protein